MIDVVWLSDDEDALEGMLEMLTARGFSVAARHASGPVHALAAFIRDHDPRVVVYDLGGPPASAAVQAWKELCREPGAHRRYVITTTTPVTLDADPCLVEAVVLMPKDFDEMCKAVQRAMKV